MINLTNFTFKLCKIVNLGKKSPPATMHRLTTQTRELVRVLEKKAFFWEVAYTNIFLLKREE